MYFVILKLCGGLLTYSQVPGWVTGPGLGHRSRVGSQVPGWVKGPVLGHRSRVGSQVRVGS